MVRKARNKIDIHSQSMVKTVFVLSSLSILAFLVLVIKTTVIKKSEPKAAETSYEIALIGKNDKVCKKVFTDFPRQLTSGCQATTTDRCDWIGEKYYSFSWYNFWHNPDLNKDDYKFKLHSEVKCGNAPTNATTDVAMMFLGPTSKPGVPTPTPIPLHCCVLEKIK